LRLYQKKSGCDLSQTCEVPVANDLTVVINEIAFKNSRQNHMADRPVEGSGKDRLFIAESENVTDVL